MLQPWKPRSVNDPRKWNVRLLVLAEESHRDTLATWAMMRRDLGSYRESLHGFCKGLYQVNLRGGYGIVHLSHGAFPMSVDNSLFKMCFIDQIWEYNSEAGWPYAWRTHEHYHHSGPKIDAGKSKCARGTNLKDVIKRSMPDLLDRSYTEKGVVYG